jgi:mono/diheme cytochrome c family protein
MKRLLLLISSIAGMATGLGGAEAKVDFAKDIQPIFQKRCIECHGPDKQKGKLRLDSKEAAFKGGKQGPVIMPGTAEKSELYRRINLPKGDDDVMPNEGELLTKTQIELLRDWINQGAVWTDTASAQPSDSAKTTSPLPADFKPSAAEQKAIAKFAEAGIEIRPIAANVPWREVNFRLHGTNVTDATLAPLKDVLSLVHLNLAATKITDAGLQHVKGLTNLLRLHLELTQITDAGLADLKGLKNLAYLNLYGTQVTDAGLEQLKGLTHLQNLYVWQSKVTEAGVADLKKALPKLDISTGWEIEALVKKEEKEKSKENDKEKAEEKK